MNTLYGIGVLCFSLLAILQCGESGDSVPTISLTKTQGLCSCKKSCLQDEDPLQSSPSSSHSSFYFDSTLSSCVQVPSHCRVDADCTFTSQKTCKSSCEVRAKESGDKEDTESSSSFKKKSKGVKADCMDAGSTKNCQHVDETNDRRHNHLPSSSHGSVRRGVRWDLVVGGTCVMVVLVAVLSVVGVVTYNYRIKKKERVRSQYIRDVLEMYDSTSDSSLSEGEQHWKEANSQQQQQHIIRL